MIGMDESRRILDRLNRLHPKSIDLSLGRIERLLERLGNPENHLPPVIHVAGTNGKGSTIALLRAILEAAGKRVHVYTSPHLIEFNERIRIAGRLIEEPRLVDILHQCEAANDGEPITQFEITTAAAFLAFAETPADYALIEVGLGGRLDATNVVANPAVTAITPIDYDHQDYLGHTLGEIAGEKAGILKPGVTGVVSIQDEEVMTALRNAARKARSPLFVQGEDWHVAEERGRLIFEDDHGLLDLPLPRLVGRHQVINAGVAVACLRRIEGAPSGAAALEQGLNEVEWRGRMQRLTGGKLARLLPPGGELWLDGAHNSAGARALAETLADMEERSPRPLYLIAGILKSKDPTEIFPHFAGLARRIFAVPIADHDAYESEILSHYATAKGIPGAQSEDVAQAIRQILMLSADAPPRIVIFGSLYLAGQVLKENGQYLKS